MSGNCDSCGGCDIDCKAAEYITSEGYRAVKCPSCETEIIIGTGSRRRKISCEECGTVIEVLPVLLN